MGIYIIISGSFVGLCGEGIGKDKGAMMKSWNEFISHKGNPFIPFILVGRFKRVTEEKLFYQPLAAETNNSRRLEK